MRRFHVHVAVDDISVSTTFYTKLFGAPARVEADYVKWMVEDPRLNFAISSRGNEPGVNHLGLQMDSDAELQELRRQIESVDLTGHEESASDCCYSTSDKYWLTDPQGVAWETYHTLASIPTFGGDRTSCASTAASSCCSPKSTGKLPSASRSSGCCA